MENRPPFTPNARTGLNAIRRGTAPLLICRLMFDIVEVDDRRVVYTDRRHNGQQTA